MYLSQAAVTSWLFLYEQNFGPHIEQNSAVLNASWLRVLSCFSRARSGSIAKANCFSQSKDQRASDIASSQSRAPGRWRATSAAWAAIL